MKVLCLCGYGNVRSSCLARQLKDWYNQDALAAGIVANSPETLRMLVSWADVILLACELKIQDYIWDCPLGKVRDFNPGPDKWQTPSNQDLVSLMTEKIEQSGLFPLRRIP
jgi:hypothetical protein